MALLELKERATRKGLYKLRQDGMIPGTIYGGKECFSVSANYKEFVKTLHEVGYNHILKVSYKGKEMMSLVKDFQVDPVKDTFLHFDLLEVVPDKVINTKVPVKLVGKSKGVVEGGLLEELMHTLSVHAKAKDLPHEVEIDITNLGIGDSIHVKDIVPPKDVQFTDVPDSVIVLVAGVKAEEETTAPVAAEGEAPKAK